MIVIFIPWASSRKKTRGVVNYIRIGYRLNVFFFTQMMLGTTHLHKIFKIKIKEHGHSIVFSMDNLYEIFFGKHTVKNTLINICNVTVMGNNEVEKVFFYIHLSPAFKVNQQNTVICISAVARKIQFGFITVTSAIVNCRNNLIFQICFPKFSQRVTHNRVTVKINTAVKVIRQYRAEKQSEKCTDVPSSDFYINT